MENIDFIFVTRELLQTYLETVGKKNHKDSNLIESPIHKFLRKIIEEMPSQIKLLLEDIELGFKEVQSVYSLAGATPYRFFAKSTNKDIRDHLEKYVIFVENLDPLQKELWESVKNSGRMWIWNNTV